MTILTTSVTRSFIGTGVGSDFATGFKFLDKTHLVVELDGDTLVLDTDYTVTGEGEDAGGTVTLVAGPLALNSTLTITRETPLLQEVDLRPQGPYEADTIEGMDDLDMCALQELNARVAALEALADLVDVPALADSTRIGPEVFTTGDNVEDSFPLNIACANGASAEYILWRVVTTAAGTFIEGVDVEWEPGLGVIQVNNITGLLPNQEYAVKGLVIFEP